MRETRKIIFHKHYFPDFYLKQTTAVREKIEYVFTVIKHVTLVPTKFLKHIEGTDGLYEIRIEYQSNIFRVFCCFDSGNLFVLFNGIQKKSQKTPKKEIDLALKLKIEYFNNKNKHHDKERTNTKR